MVDVVLFTLAAVALIGGAVLMRAGLAVLFITAEEIHEMFMEDITRKRHRLPAIRKAGRSSLTGGRGGARATGGFDD